MSKQIVSFYEEDTENSWPNQKWNKLLILFLLKELKKIKTQTMS